MKQTNIFYRFGSRCMDGFMWFVFLIWTGLTWLQYRPKITYLPGAKPELLRQPCIYIANHFCHRDGSFAAQALYRSKMYTVITRKWYDIKAANIFLRHLRYIPIDLKIMDSTWIPAAQEKMKKGFSILIFPEGTRNPVGQMGEFHAGFLMLAKFTDAPIIPLAIRGPYKLFHRQELLVGPPIEFDVHQKGRPSVIMREGALLCREQIETMLSH